MKSYIYFMRYFIAFLLLMLMACGGGGGGGSSAPTPTPNILLAQSTINFGGSLLSSGSGQTFTIKNVGDANLTIGQISKPGLPFSIPDINDFCSNKTLTPSQTCALTVLFSPTAQGPSAGNFAIPSNDPDSSNVNITLSGEGYGLNVWVNQVNTNDCLSFVAKVTVTDPANPDPGSANNVLLRGLAASNFTLNGGLLPITLPVSNQYPSPVSLVLALDSSESLTGVMTDIKTAAKSLISLLGPEDEAAIYKFYAFINFYPTAAPLFETTDGTGKSNLNTYIETSYGGSFTALYDAIVQSIDRAAQGTPGKRKVVIVLSDGVDNYSTTTKTMDEVIAHAVLQKIPVFTIYHVDPAYGGGAYGNTQIMQRLARETGGQYYYSATADLATVVQQIAGSLSNTYTINYTSPTSMCSGTLDVRAAWGVLYGQGTGSISNP